MEDLITLKKYGKRKNKILGAGFFRKDDVVQLAKDLIGKVIVSKTQEGICSGIITETEAYAGTIDRASHAYGGRFTERTKVMYEDAGTIYIYICYGVHPLFNFVTNKAGVPHAILLRAVYPLEGKELIRKRRNRKEIPDGQLCLGPGNVSKAFGFNLQFNGMKLGPAGIYVEDRAISVPPELIQTGPRIGVESAGKDALLPYRFFVNHKVFAVPEFSTE